MTVSSVLDLSHFIEEGMPVYPGTESPGLREANTLEKDGFREKLITMYSHTGTHMDAPAHILPGAPFLDELPPERFIGTAVVLDAGRRDGGTIGVEFLEHRSSDIDAADFLLLKTGWDRLWGRDGYFSGYPVLDEAAARWIAGRNLSGVGMDCISADPADAPDLPVHRILLAAGMVIVENLTGLDSLSGFPVGSFLFTAAPLKIRNADGSPVRAAAVLA